MPNVGVLMWVNFLSSSFLGSDGNFKYDCL